MSKKQVRISDPQEIKKRMNEFLNREISLVMKDKTVVYGTLREAAGDTITVSNMRRRKMTFSCGQISELYTDLDS